MVKCTEHFAETFVPNYGNKGNVLLHNICRSNIFYSDQTSFDNILRHVSTCMNKAVKRSRLFPLEKCWMLYCEKSRSFDLGLTHPTHCNNPPPPPPPHKTHPTHPTPYSIKSLYSPHLFSPLCSPCLLYSPYRTHSLISLFTQLLNYLTPLIPLTLLNLL